jgi:hypothetical protein
VTGPGHAPAIAIGFFLVGAGAAFGAHRLSAREDRPAPRPVVVGLGVMAFVSFCIATTIPLIIGSGPSSARPSSPAQLHILSPRLGQLIRGAPALVSVELRLDRATVLPPGSTTKLDPGAGHIHLYLDGALVSMAGLKAQISVGPGEHTLRAEFVAADHGPFRPPVVAAVTFHVSG